MATNSSARLERETEQTRAQLEQTLDELRLRLSPGQLMDRATDYLRHGSGRAFLGNLRDQVVSHPLPVTLIGAGIAWLAISGAVGHGNGAGRLGRARRGDGGNGDWGDTAATADDLAHGGRDAGGEPGGTAWDKAKGLGSRARQGAEDMTDRARETAEGWIDETRETADEARYRTSGFYDRTIGKARQAADAAPHYAESTRRRVADSGDALMNFCREQPMLVAGIGVALGAALGAMLPGTRAERQVMGEASRDVQEKVGDMAVHQYERAKKVGGDLYDEAKERASEELDSELKQASRASGDATGRSGDASQSAAPYAEAAEAGSSGESELARSAESAAWREGQGRERT